MNSPTGKSRLVASIPNMLTLANGVCGFSAIVCASNSSNPANNSVSWLLCSMGLIVLAMVFDAFDGWTARKLGVSSDIGAQLDSLCDAVSFGVAPAFIMFNACFGGVPTVILWLVGALYCACAIFRLARFNVQTEDHSAESHRWFTGLPSPAAAGLVLAVASALLLCVAPGQPGHSELAYMVIELTGLAALLMVSRIKFPHLSQFIRILKGRA